MELTLKKILEKLFTFKNGIIFRLLHFIFFVRKLDPNWVLFHRKKNLIYYLTMNYSNIVFRQLIIGNHCIYFFKKLPKDRNNLKTIQYWDGTWNARKSVDPELMTEFKIYKYKGCIWKIKKGDIFCDKIETQSFNTMCDIHRICIHLWNFPTLVGNEFY